MTKREAYDKLLVALRDATDEQALALKTCLRLGAGCLGLPDGSVLTVPQGLPADRRETYLSLCEGIRWLSTEETTDDTTYRPTRAGAWEPVLATLTIDGAWPQIIDCARELEEAFPHD